MSFYELVAARRSHRAYTERPIAPEVLTSILETARLAPSAANRQPWHITVVQSPAKLNGLAASYTRDWFRQAPVVLAISGFGDLAWKRSYDQFSSLDTDLSILTTHLLLAAQDAGLATCWIAHFEPQVAAQALGLAVGEIPFALVTLGYAPEEQVPAPPKTRKTFEEVVTYL